MNEKEEVGRKIREAVEAAVKVYAGDDEWHAWAESWLSKNDSTSQAAEGSLFGFCAFFDLFAICTPLLSPAAAL
jgi:hypothetical protein